MLAGAAATLAACGRPGDARGVSLWAMDVEGENARALLPAFTRATAAPVELQWLAWTAAHQKLLTAYAGGALPDVTMLAADWTREFARLRAITPAPPLRGGALIGQDRLTLSGRPYARPWTVDTAVQFFRRDLLEAAGHPAPPDRLDPWKAALRDIKRRAPDRYAVLMQLNWPDHLMALAAQQDAPLLRDRDARGNFSSPEFQHTLGFYKSLFDEGLAPRVSSLEASDPVGELARGWVAVYPAGAWIRAELNRRPAELAPARWGVAAMPGWAGPGRAIVAPSALAVTRDARDRGRAAELIAFLTSAEVQTRFFRVAGVLPTRPQAWGPLLSDPVLAAFYAQLGRATPMPQVQEWARLTTEVQLIAERMVRGALSVAQAAAEMDRTADALLAKRRWMLDRGLLDDGGRSPGERPA